MGVRKTFFKMKRWAHEKDTFLFKIYSQELGELHNKTEMPGQLTPKRVLYQHMCKSQGNQAEAEKCKDVIFDK